MDYSHIIKVFWLYILSLLKRKVMQDKIIPKYGQYFFSILLIFAVLEDVIQKLIRNKILNNILFLLVNT